MCVNHQRENICQKEVFHKSCLPVNKHMSQVCFAFFALQTGQRVGKSLHIALQKILDEEESLGASRPKVGFLG